MTSGSISDSYARGNVSGRAMVGGVVGDVSTAVATTLARVYATGLVTGISDLGGLVGNIRGTGGGGITRLTLQNSFWDTTATGQNSAVGTVTSGHFLTLTNTVGKTTADMQAIATYSGASWDISGSTTGVYPQLSMGGSTTWTMDTPLPRLTYTLSDFSKTHDADAVDLNVLYGGAGAIFGYKYKNWVQGTDYQLVDGSNNAITSVTDAATYQIVARVLNSAYATATAGNTASTIIINPSSTAIYLRLIPGSSIYGDTPVFTYGLYDTAAGGGVISNASPTGTASWSTALSASSNAGSYSLTYGSGITLGNSAYTLSVGDAANWTITPRTVTLSANKVISSKADPLKRG